MSSLDHRFWEIDSLRGVAIILMIIYHFLFDLNFLNIINFNLHSTAMRIFLYPIGTIFLGLVGVSLSLSHSKAQQRQLSQHQIISKYIKRGLTIFTLGLLITLITWMYLPQEFVVFGVLHCIGLSIILAIPLLRLRILNLILGALLIPLGVLLQTMTFKTPWLFWLGFTSSSFYSLDYFPLLPWFGVITLGIYLGNTLYPHHQRKIQIPDLSQNSITKILCFLGRNSLIIYFLHQPLILLVLHLLFMI